MYLQEVYSSTQLKRNAFFFALFRSSNEFLFILLVVPVYMVIACIVWREAQNLYHYGKMELFGLALWHTDSTLALSVLQLSLSQLCNREPQRPSSHSLLTQVFINVPCVLSSLSGSSICFFMYVVFASSFTFLVFTYDFCRYSSAFCVFLLVLVFNLLVYLLLSFCCDFACYCGLFLIFLLILVKCKTFHICS